MSPCGCSPKPRLAWTRSSFITRNTPNWELAGLRYSANAKWNLLLSQFCSFQVGLLGSLAPLPNHLGFGSETNNFSLGMTLMTGEDIFVGTSQVVVEEENAWMVVERLVINSSFDGRENRWRSLLEAIEGKIVGDWKLKGLQLWSVQCVLGYFFFFAFAWNSSKIWLCNILKL